MKVSVLGCGRWGSFLAWYLARIHAEVMIYGREGSATLVALRRDRKNEYVTLPASVSFTTSLKEALDFAETVVISVGTQQLDGLAKSIASVEGHREKEYIL